MVSCKCETEQATVPYERKSLSSAKKKEKKITDVLRNFLRSKPLVQMNTVK